MKITLMMSLDPQILLLVMVMMYKGLTERRQLLKLTVANIR